MIIDQVPEEGLYMIYEADRQTYDWTHLNKFHVRLRSLEEIREHQGYKQESGPRCYGCAAFTMWVAPNYGTGLNWANCDELEADMPYDIYVRTNLDDPREVGGFAEYADLFTHGKQLHDWLLSNPVIEGKHLSRRLGEDLVGDWRSKQQAQQADLEARAEDPPFYAGAAKGLIKQLKDECNTSEVNCHMTVWGRNGTHYSNKSYRIYAERDSVWNKSKCDYVPRIYLLWDKSFGKKTSAADIVDKLCSVVSAKTTVDSWHAGGDIWV
jgi:hypothetical protein